MKAIIIQDADASNLLDLLKLQKYTDPAMWSNTEAWQSLPENVRNGMVGDLHRHFHYVVCRWLQEQGASVVR